MFAPAYASLAGNYYWSNFWPTLPPRDTYPKSKAAAQKALNIDSTLADAHCYLALAAQEYDWNFAEAEKEFKRALELNPNDGGIHHLYSHFLQCMGRAEESRSEDRRTEEIDPANPGLIACLGWHSVVAGDYEEAEKRSHRALSMGAGDFPRLFLGWSFEQRNRFNEAIVEFQKAVVGWNGAVFPTALLGQRRATEGCIRKQVGRAPGWLLKSDQAAGNWRFVLYRRWMRHSAVHPA